MSVYLDNSATTPVCPRAKERMRHALDCCWGNPSSIHKKGLEALEELEDARHLIAKRLSCADEEIYFTPGGTQSNNIALLGAVNALKRRGNKIVTTSIEHPSVENGMKGLEAQGFEIVRLKTDAKGIIDLTELLNAIDEKTILVSMMTVNNEIGSIQPVSRLKKAVLKKKSPALIHTDAVQAFGKVPIHVKELDVDMMSVSAHKIHGPKGAGALYIKKGTRIVSPVFGGGQEKGISSGTHPMPAIAGFAGAVEEMPEDIAEQTARVGELRDYFVREVSRIPNCILNSPENALPYIVNLSFLSIPTQPMINYLSEREIYISGGSACSKGHRSNVLTAMGLDSAVIDSALRISFSRYTAKEEIDILLESLNTAEASLRKTIHRIERYSKADIR